MKPITKADRLITKALTAKGWSPKYSDVSYAGDQFTVWIDEDGNKITITLTEDVI